MKKILLLLFVAILSIGIIGCSSDAEESESKQDEKNNYPDEKIKIIVHSSAGGPTDTMAREVGKAIEEVSDTTVEVEIAEGGSGAIAMSKVYQADPDGYTLGAMTPSHIGLINGTLKDQYSLDDFTWTSRAQIDPYVLVTHVDSPYDSMEDVVDILKDEPNSITVGGYGAAGSGHNIAWKIFEDAAGIEAEWVPYEGTTDAVTAILGKNLDIANSNPGQVAQYVEDGDLKILGVTAEDRLDSFPDVPTVLEQGFDVDTGWAQFRGFYGPKDIPKEVMSELDSILEKAYQTDSYKEYMEKAKLAEGTMLHEEFSEYVEQQSDLTNEWYEKLGVN